MELSGVSDRVCYLLDLQFGHIAPLEGGKETTPQLAVCVGVAFSAGPQSDRENGGTLFFQRLCSVPDLVAMRVRAQQETDTTGEFGQV